LQVRCVSAIGERPASFEISMVDPAPVHAEVFDLGGRRVASRMLAEDVQEVLGFSLPGDRLASGVYWLRVTQGPHRAVTRFVILRP
ncbi:MAG: T9SS type A sorting domain-containing protein, partial [Candidatus Eiseniibacteriota bacterium]